MSSGLVAVLESPAGAATGGGPDLLRYALVCGGLLVAVVVGACVFRRAFAGTLKRRAALRTLQIVDALPLGGKQRLLVVRCYDRSFLVGVGDKEITRLAELEDAPESTMPTPEFAERGLRFAELLARRGAAAPTAATPAAQKGERRDQRGGVIA